MIDDTIAAIEARLRAANLSPEQRADLQNQLSKLKVEIVSKKNPQSIRKSLESFSAAVAGLEAQHPQLTELVSSLSLLLSNTGI